ncbi:uncharacterized protein LOC108161359 [Drosophila miranda]|uniref:uncharacterized protein LOC108161359 n=1 Tax=Drosophila miranda TaxID=7229 RepID=UPI0007E65B77|nr:uncharacterized protein LOC108161359 [Drosophila miranda]
MGNRIRHRRRRTSRSADSMHPPEPKVSYWPFWRVVYWLVVFIVVVSLCVGLYLTISSDMGQCHSYDVRCE